MIRPPEDWQEKWLEIQRIELVRSILVGSIERWIRWRVETLTSQQLFHAERELMDKMREVQKGRASLADVYKAWSLHPLQKILLEERMRREYLLKSNSDDYLGPLSSLSERDINDFLIWKGEKHGSVQEWRKDKKKSLPVIPSKIVGDEKETQTDDGRLSGGGEGIPNGRPDRKSHLQGQKTSSQEARAYGPGKKRT